MSTVTRILTFLSLSPAQNSANAERACWNMAKPRTDQNTGSCCNRHNIVLANCKRSHRHTPAWADPPCLKAVVSFIKASSSFPFSGEPFFTSHVSTFAPRHAALHSGGEDFFRVHEFQFLLGKICVAHSVDHSFTLLLCCALSIVVGIPPASPRRYSKFRRSSSHMSPQ